MSEWNFITLKEAGVQLIDCVHKTPEAKDNGFYYIAIPQMKDGRIDTTDARLISEEDYKKWTIKANPKKWDIVLSRRCNPGVTSVVSGEFKFALGQNLVLLRSDGSKIYPPFLKWLVNSKYWWAEISKYLNVGAVFESLKCADVPNFELPVPSLEIQKEISKTLESLDQKITLLRQQNQTLEELAQTLFKRWFVEFEFPIENGKPYKENGGAMVESELGEIPEGWNVGCLKDVTSLISRGVSPKYLEEGGICVLNQRCIRNKSIDFSIGRRHDNELKNASSKFIKAFDVLVNSTGEGTLGRTAIVKRIEEEPTTVDSHVSIIRASEKINKYFLAYLITGREREIERMAEGTTGQTELSRAKLNEMEVLIPPKVLQDKFGEISFCHNQKISANEQEIQTLTQLRDTLLPKLMSGELRVKTDYE